MCPCQDLNQEPFDVSYPCAVQANLSGGGGVQRQQPNTPTVCTAMQTEGWQTNSRICGLDQCSNLQSNKILTALRYELPVNIGIKNGHLCLGLGVEPILRKMCKVDIKLSPQKSPTGCTSYRIQEVLSWCCIYYFNGIMLLVLKDHLSEELCVARKECCWQPSWGQLQRAFRYEAAVSHSQYTQ